MGLGSGLATSPWSGRVRAYGKKQGQGKGKDRREGRGRRKSRGSRGRGRGRGTGRCSGRGRVRRKLGPLEGEGIRLCPCLLGPDPE